MDNLVDRFVYRLASLWWTTIYGGLCRQDRSTGAEDAAASYERFAPVPQAQPALIA